MSKILGSYIKEHYDLPDHRGDAAYASWQTCLEEWRAEWPDYAETVMAE